MSLFGSKKEEHDNAQTNSIKEVAGGTDFSQNNPPIQQTQQPANQDFINPFAQNQTNPVQTEEPFKDATQVNNPFAPPQQTQQPTNNNNNNNQEQIQANQQQYQPNLNNMNFTEENQDIIDKEKIQEMIDETVEKIIEERWEKLVSNIDKVVKWKDKVEIQVNLVKEDINSIKGSFEDLEKKLVNKISSYDRNILDVNSEIKALEKVFQKITPTLVNNVNELARITEELKTPIVKEKFQNK